MKRLIWMACVLALALGLAAGAAWADDCKGARGDGVVLQPGGLFTNWYGPVTLQVLGHRLEGEATVFIDPLLWLMGPGPPPVSPFAGFDWVKMDFGEDGSFTIWEMSYFVPRDPSLTEWSYEGYGRLGWAYQPPPPGIWGPWGSGRFEGATGELNTRGTMWLTQPDPVNRVEFTFKGKLCGVQWDSE